MGRELATRRIQIVFGGGRVGLMGIMADAAMAAGGRVIGVIPRHLEEREVGHEGLTELHVVASMHERKALMAQLSDGFVAMPGGIGTLEEFFEVWTWGQLGLHRKPYALLDVGGFYQPLVAFLDGLVERRFVRPEHRAMLIVEAEPARLVDRMASHTMPQLDKWLDRGET